MDTSFAYLLCAAGVGFVLGCFVGNIRTGNSEKVTFHTEGASWEVQGSSIADLMRQLASLKKK